MVAYGIDIISMIKKLKAEFSDVTQPWYDDDAGALGMFLQMSSYILIC